MKVAIVCDWLLGIGGAERVILELHKLYPDAPIYTSQYDPTKIDWFADADVRTTWLQKLPKSLKKFLPVFRAYAFSRLDLTEYDLVIISSSAEAKAVKTRPDATTVCYCHSPTHYYWIRYDEYLKNPGFGKLDWLARIGLKILVGPMKRWDYKAAQKPTYLLANSTHTAGQIKKYYNRDSTIVFPPIDIDRFSLSNKKGNAFVAVGRQTPYKRIDLAVAAATELSLPLTVIGNGPAHQQLVEAAGPSVTFVTDASDASVAAAMQQAKALIFPNMDDFGITAVEALAAGTPVVAYKAGGALDYVKPGITGVFFKEQTVASVVMALKDVDSMKFDARAIRDSAKQFSTQSFIHNMKDFVEKHCKTSR